MSKPKPPKRLCAHCGRKPAKPLSVDRLSLVFCSLTCAAIEALDQFQQQWCPQCGEWSHQDDWSLMTDRYDEPRCPNCERPPLTAEQPPVPIPCDRDGDGFTPAD